MTQKPLTADLPAIIDKAELEVAGQRKYDAYSAIDQLFSGLDLLEDPMDLKDFIEIKVLDDVTETTVMLKENEMYLGGLANGYVLPQMMDGKVIREESFNHARRMNTVIIRIAKVLDQNCSGNLIPLEIYTRKDSTDVSINDMFHGVDPRGNYIETGVSISSLHLAAKIVYDHHNTIAKIIG